MNILIHPSFRNGLNKKKKKLRDFEVVGLEKFLVGIEEDPGDGIKITGKNLYQKVYTSNYFVCIVIYEYDEKKDRLIFWSLE